MALLSLNRARGDVGHIPLCVFEIESDEEDHFSANGDGSVLLDEISLASHCTPSGTAPEVDGHLRARHPGPRMMLEVAPARELSEADLVDALLSARSLAKQIKAAVKAKKAFSQRLRAAKRRTKEAFHRAAEEKSRRTAERLAAIKQKEAELQAECERFNARQRAVEHMQRVEAERIARETEARNNRLAEAAAFHAKWKSREEHRLAQQAEYDRFIEAGLTAAEADIGALVAKIKRFGLGIPLHLVVEPALVSLAGGAKDGGMCFVSATRPDDKRRIGVLIAAIKAGAGSEKVELALVPLE